MVGDLGSTTKGSAKCGNGRAKLRLSDDDVGTAALIFLCTQKLTIRYGTGEEAEKVWRVGQGYYWAGFRQP
jgi:hypothetical protein